MCSGQPRPPCRVPNLNILHGVACPGEQPRVSAYEAAKHAEFCRKCLLNFYARNLKLETTHLDQWVVAKA